MERHCQTRTMPKVRRAPAAAEILFSFPQYPFSKMHRVQAHQGKKLAQYFPLSTIQCGTQTCETLNILFLCYFLPFLVCRNKPQNSGPDREVRPCTHIHTHSPSHVWMYVYSESLERFRDCLTFSVLHSQSYILIGSQQFDCPMFIFDTDQIFLK